MGRFQPVAKIDEIPEESGKTVEVQGRRIAVFHVQGKFYAMDDTCTHAEASLGEGEVFDFEVECPRHGARFDLRTGEALTLPAFRPVQTYEVKVEGDQVLVALE